MDQPQTKAYFRHLIISFTLLVFLVGVLFLSFPFIKNILLEPQKYFNSDLSVVDLQFEVIAILLIILFVLISYVTYLLLTSKTRIDLAVREATLRLSVSREQLRRIYESAPVPYLTIDSKAEIIEPNKAALRFFGVVPEEIKNKSIFSFQPEEDQDVSERLIQKYKSSIPINREEVRFITKSGKVKFVSLSIFEMKNSGSLTRSGLVTIFDITEQRELDKAKTEFVSLASHQLRTPLATIKWFADLLLSGGIGEINAKQKNYIEKLHEVNEGMIDLVGALLNVSRIEMGSLPVDLLPTNVEDIIESVLTELSSQIDLKKIHFIKQYDGYLQNIKSDPKLLRIVIQNLISNAVKYTPDEGTVTVTLRESTAEKLIIISDTGLGIPKAQQHRVFEKLFRADNVRILSTSQGTGLGLYLVKSIIETLGGSISFVSEENKGSVFTIKM